MAGNKISFFDYEYLAGRWEGVRGAAFNECAEYCRENGYGNFGEPTDKGRKEMEKFDG